MAVALLNFLQKERVSFESGKISWKGPIGRYFSVSEAVKVLSLRSTLLFPIKGIWVHCVPTKATFFAWEATWGKILTLDKLQRRGWHLPNHSYLRGCDEESAHHILLHCLVVSHLWVLFLSFVGLSRVFPKMVKEALLSWKCSFVGKKKKKHVEICSALHLLDSVE